VSDVSSWIREGSHAHGEVPPDLSAMTDADLAVARDRSTFLELYDRYVARIERYVAARTSPADVEDIVSMTFERALARRTSFRPGKGTYASWLFTIARNVIADTYRAKARRAEQQSIPVEEDGDPGPEDVALAHEDRLRVRAAIQELTPDQRDALALRFAGELPFSEVASALGKSEPAAKMLVQRALNSLRRLLQEDDHEE
jgi:RNA polymerase sigma-70 factor (ECF subfamily)